MFLVQINHVISEKRILLQNGYTVQSIKAIQITKQKWQQDTQTQTNKQKNKN